MLGYPRYPIHFGWILPEFFVGIRGTGLSRPIASRLPGAWWAWCWCCEIGSPAGIDYVYVVPSMAMGQNWVALDDIGWLDGRENKIYLRITKKKKNCGLPGLPGQFFDPCHGNFGWCLPFCPWGFSLRSSAHGKSGWFSHEDLGTPWHHFVSWIGTGTTMQQPQIMKSYGN